MTRDGVHYRIDRDGNNEYCVLWRAWWWPFWFTVKDYDIWGDVSRIRLFPSCAAAKECVLTLQHQRRRRIAARQWKRDVCRSVIK